MHRPGMEESHGVKLVGLQGDRPVCRVNSHPGYGERLVSAIGIQMVALNHIHITDGVNTVIRNVGSTIILVDNHEAVYVSKKGAGSRKLWIEIG